MSDDSKMVLVCSLWKNTTRAGETMLSGNLNFSSRIVILKNKKKQPGEADAKKPDFLLFLAPNDPAPKSPDSSGI
jgi:hypothetical protein